MSKSTANEKAGRYVSLDIVRGIAALSVVFWHWQHFYFSTPQQQTAAADSSLQPLYSVFWPFYQSGFLAVDLFFCLSGFVFFYLYANVIRDGKMDGDSFALLRFSRLYPLHFATLIAVAALQAIYIRQHGAYFVYQANDAPQFVVHFLLISSWPPNFVYAFNGPIWSVSIEVMLYIAFFALCRVKLTAPVFLAALSIIGSIVFMRIPMVGRGFHSFFLGGLCYYTVQRQQGGNNFRWIYLAACIAAIEAVSVVATIMRGHPRMAETLVVSAAFPALIVILALLEHRIERFTRPIGWIGNRSYSSYLLHFPLQLLLVVVAFSLGVTPDYASPLTLALFMMVLIALSLWSFYAFERPLQGYLRKTILPRIQAAQKYYSG
jgi:peptidoglycan/LPS O-acetylase OafA/YrhL